MLSLSTPEYVVRNTVSAISSAIEKIAFLNSSSAIGSDVSPTTFSLLGSHACFRFSQPVRGLARPKVERRSSPASRQRGIQQRSIPREAATAAFEAQERLRKLRDGHCGVATVQQDEVGRMADRETVIG